MKIVVVMVPVIAMISLIFAYGLASWIGKMSEGTERMKQIAGYIREGVTAFLKREYKTMVIAILVLFIILGFSLNWTTAVLYLFGVLFSALSGFFGMKAATRGNVRTANAAVNDGMKQALETGLRSGAVMGLCLAGFALLGIGGIFAAFGVKSASIITGFGLGASTTALFSRVGGGIFTKAADSGINQIQKYKADIPQDDHENPAIIADLTGVNAGNVAGLGSDLFESYTASIIAAIILASVTKSINPKFGYPFDLPVLQGSVFPLILSAVGMIASIFGIMFFRGKEGKNPAAVFKTGIYLSGAILIILDMIISWIFFGNFNCAIAVIAGFAAGLAVRKATEVYTSDEFKHVRKIVERSHAGHASTIISGIGSGMMSSAWLIILITAGILTANAFAGLYGIALAAVGMLSAVGMSAAIDTYGTVAHNAGRISQMAMLPAEAKKITDQLDATGMRISATGKGFAAGSASMAALALFIAYFQITGLKAINIQKPSVIIGLFLGAVLPVLFAALTMNTVGKSACHMIEEMRRQFKEVLCGGDSTSVLNYAKCVDIGAKAAMKETVALGLFAILVPLIVGILAGTEALGGLLASSLTTGTVLSFMLTNAGSAWNNAKRYIEEGDSETGSDAYNAAATGAAVGNSLKDTMSPSINILIKLIAVTAVIFAPIFAAVGGSI